MKVGKREKRKSLKIAADKLIIKINNIAKKAYQDDYRLDIVSSEKGGIIVYTAKINKAENKSPIIPKKRGRPKKLASINSEMPKQPKTRKNK